MILLDTHVLVWWLSGNEKALSPSAKKIISGNIALKKIFVSSISAWEIAMLSARGRLMLSLRVETWLEKAAAIPALTFVPVDNEIAVSSVELPEWSHKDPADRLIVATARKLSAKLVTADEKIHACQCVKWVW